MMLIGCDFHPSWQQVNWLDTETEETGERKLVQASGDAERFYRQVAAPALIGMEATGNSHWLVDLSTPRADGRSWGRSPSRATACCACCWWKRRRPRCVTIPSFVESICIAVTRSRKRWPRWQRHASWRYDCTGCCAPSSRIQPLFASRAARGCPWSARARPKELIGRSRIPHRRDVRIAESWPSVRSNRWLVERLHRRVIQVRFPESWSSTFSGKASGAHAPPRIFLS